MITTLQWSIIIARYTTLNAQTREVDENFGKTMYIKVFALIGQASLDDLNAMTTKVTKAIGMNKEGLHAANWTYPAFGHGGTGTTFVQPITESFIAADTWTEHGGFYYFVVSCRKIEDDSLLIKTIEDFFPIHDQKEMEIGLGSAVAAAIG